MPTVDANESASLAGRLTRTAGVAAGLILTAMCLPLVLHRIHVADDLLNYHLPLRQFYAGCLHSGDAFDWMPGLFSGYFLTGSGQAGTYHPWHWMLYRWLPLETAFTLELTASYPFMLVGMWLWLSRILRRSDSAAIGAITFTFSGFCTLHFLHPNAIAVVSHLPWLLFAEHILLRSEQSSRRRQTVATAGVAILTGSQLLLGYPQYVWYSLLAEAVFCLSFSSPSWRCVRRLTWLAMLKLTGLALGAVQVLPSMEALAVSDRTAMPPQYFHEFPISLADLLQLIHPFLTETRVFGQNTHELGLYCGAIPVVLAALAIARCRSSFSTSSPGSRSDDSFDHRRLFAFAIILGILAVWLALGVSAGLYAVQLKLPLIGSFRWPARIIVLIHFSLAVLAAIGFQRLVTAENSVKRSSRWLLAFPVASLSSAVVARLCLSEGSAAPLALLVVGPILFGLAAVMVRDAARGRLSSGLILFLAGDLAAYGFTYEALHHSESLSTVLANISQPPGNPGDGRVIAEIHRSDDSVGFGGNELLLHGWHQADGYEGLMPRTFLSGDAMTLDGLRVSGVRWIVNSGEHRTIEGVLPAVDPLWLEVPNPLPRARLAEATRVLPDLETAATKVSADGLVIVTSNVAFDQNSNASVAGTLSETSITVDRPGQIVVQTAAASPKLLVVAERYSAGWTATVNGRAASLIRADLDFIGLPVPGGTSTVELRFNAASVTTGRAISLVAIMIVAMLTAARWLTCRTSRTTDSSDAAVPA